MSFKLSTLLSILVGLDVDTSIWTSSQLYVPIKTLLDPF